MKTNVKKIMFGLGIALLGNFAANAQNGLEGIIVEKYYQANSTDVTNSVNNGASPLLSTNSITYRVYVDMAPGYRYNLTYGDLTHPWIITSSTSFYNDPNNGVKIGPAQSLTNARKNTVMIDSYLTGGGVMAGKVGVLKTEDTDGSIGNSNGALTNTLGGVFGVAINSVVAVNAQDGYAVGTPGSCNDLGLGVQADIFDATLGGSFFVNGGQVGVLGGVVGTTTTNAVLIGQFTTDGVFGFQLNVQVQNTVTGVAENWVASNPQPGEFSLASLILAPPSVSITSPANGANFVTGSTVSITANAVASGTVTQVQFFVDGVSVGTDLTAPYASTYVATNGTHTITADVTDNTGAVSTSSSVVITAATNQAPTITVSSPANALTGSLVTFTATANDVDGTVASVTFSVDNVAIGTVNTAPYTYTWTAINGPHNVKASAVDNLGAIGLSLPVNITVVNNIFPSVSITSPANNASFIAPQVVTITATATDADGSVTLVEAFVNNVSIGSFTTGGPNYTFSYATSSLSTLDVIKVVATDNSAATSTSSPISLQILNSNGLPYSIGSIKQKCTQSDFCLPVSAALTYTVDNVIGYDVVLNYDATKVTPTGSVTVNGALITPSIVTISNTFSNGVMNISAYLNANALANSEWNGTGEIFCVGFTKNGSFGSVDTAAFDIPFLQESYFSGVVPKLVSDAEYTTYKDTMFNGSIKFWADNSAMGYDNINTNAFLITNIYGTDPSCVTSTFAPVQPDLTGNFIHNTLHGSSIAFERDINGLTNIQPAVNVADINIVRSILLNTATGSLTPTVYQFIAADVNIDGVVSAGDLSQIQLRSIDQIQEFKQTWNYNAAGTNTLGVPSKDWTFVDSARVQTNSAYAISATYPSNDNVGYSKAKVPVTPFCLPVPVTGLLSCPSLTNEVYKGIMTGDVNGNFAVVNNTVNPYRPAGDKIVIDLSKSIVSGNTVELPVTFVSSTPVLGIDFSMQFDESNLTYNSVVNYPSTTEALAYFNTNTKNLKFDASNVNLAPYSANQAVAFLRFDSKTGVVDSDQFSSLVGYINGEVVPMEVVNKTVGINSLNGTDNSVSIFPNPTNGIINVTSISDATVEVCDITGKDVLFQTTVSASKTQQINVSNFVNGVYVVKIYNNDFISIKKVVLNK